MIQNSQINRLTPWGEKFWAFNIDISPCHLEKKIAAQIAFALWNEVGCVRHDPGIFAQLRTSFASQFNNTAIVLKYSLVPHQSQPFWLSSKGSWNVFQNVLKSNCLISARLRKICYVAQNCKLNKWNVNIDLKQVFNKTKKKTRWHQFGPKQWVGRIVCVCIVRTPKDASYSFSLTSKQLAFMHLKYFHASNLFCFSLPP